MNTKIILMFLAISVLSFFNCKNSTIEMIKEIGINSRYYPKRYVVVHRGLRKTFRIKQSRIPRYLYFELIIAIVFAVLGLINSVIACFFHFDKKIVGILTMIHVCLIILNMLFFSVISLCFKKNEK